MNFRCVKFLSFHSLLVFILGGWRVPKLDIYSEWAVVDNKHSFIENVISMLSLKFLTKSLRISLLMLRFISISSIFLASSLLAATTFDAGVLIPKEKNSYHDLVFGLLSDLSKLVSIFIFWQNFVLFNKLFKLFPAILSTFRAIYWNLVSVRPHIISICPYYYISN